MRFSAANIPLTVFAATATGLVGLAFCAGPLSVWPYTIRAYGLISFVPLLDVLVASTGLLVIGKSPKASISKIRAETKRPNSERSASQQPTPDAG